jgi:hypothetical protein
MNEFYMRFFIKIENKKLISLIKIYLVIYDEILHFFGNFNLCYFYLFLNNIAKAYIMFVNI